MVLALLSKRDITGFDVCCPMDHDGKLGGEDAIRELLDGISFDKNFGRLEHLILMIDADDDPVAKFSKMQSVLQKTQPISNSGLRYPVPTAVDTFVSVAGAPSVAITLLPGGGRAGAMESLCWQAGVTDHQELVKCINEFGNCVGISGWLPQKQDKFKLRCLITGANQTNPDLPTTQLWNEVPELVPVDSAVFDALASFLKSI